MTIRMTILITLVFSLLVLQSIVLAGDSNSNASSRLSVISKPSNLVFNYQNGPIAFADLQNLLVSTLGYSTDQDVTWTGLSNTDAVKFPNALMIFLADAQNVNAELFKSTSIQISGMTKRFNTDSFDYLKSKTNASIFKYENLQSSLDVSSDCISQMNPEVYVFSVDKKDSANLINLIDSEKTNYQNKCGSELLVLLISQGQLEAAAQQLKKRAVTDSAPSASIIINPAVFYSDQYPAMFNLFFWTALVIALAVFGISYCMWFMDPGLDTVIYRMTSQRIKKDQ